MQEEDSFPRSSATVERQSIAQRARREDAPSLVVAWQPMELAPRKAGAEILGVRYAGGVMKKEPFITFWSPTLDRFYCDPTHWIALPEPPR